MKLKVGGEISIGAVTYTVKTMDKGVSSIEDAEGALTVLPESVLRAALMGDKVFVEAKSALDKAKVFRLLTEESLSHATVSYYDAVALTLICGFSDGESEARHAEFIKQLDVWSNEETDWSVIHDYFTERKRRWFDS